MEVKIDNKHLVVSPHSDISVRQMVQINDGETERKKNNSWNNNHSKYTNYMISEMSIGN